MIDTNLRSFFLICKHAVSLMRLSGKGRIVNVSSIAGRHKSIVSGVHYTSSKYGIIGLTKQLAQEVSQHNILVNCVCPSQTMTNMLAESMSDSQLEYLGSKIPVRRIATVTEQAMPILFWFIPQTEVNLLCLMMCHILQTLRLMSFKLLSRKY